MLAALIGVVVVFWLVSSIREDLKIRDQAKLDRDRARAAPPDTERDWFKPSDNKAQVEFVHGKPDKVIRGGEGMEVWLYGGSQVAFKEGFVRGWMDAGNLNIESDERIRLW